MPTDESLPRLTPKQIQVLVVLMAEARELTNNELTELAGFSLTGQDSTKLNALGLVDTDRTHRPFSHALTERGWAVTRQIHMTTPPKAGGSAARSLFTLLANMHRSLERLQISHAEFFKRAVVHFDHSGDVESQVRGTYADLAKTPGAWVGLADLRDHLGDVDRNTLDETLRAMARHPDVRIIPIADTKNLDARDRSAALRIGAEDNHTIAIGQS